MDRGLGACGSLELRTSLTDFQCGNESVLPYRSPRLQARGRCDDNVNGDILAICSTVLDGGLRTDLELPFHPGIVIDQEFDRLAFLTLHNLQREGNVTDRLYFPRCRGIVDTLSLSR